MTLRRLGLIAAWMALAALLLLRPVPSARGKAAARPLADNLPPDQAEAQALALADARVQTMISGRRAEVFGVKTLGAEFTPASAACATHDCRQVETYDFDGNATVAAIVDLSDHVVRDVLYQPGVHPGVSQRINELAINIARSAPDLRSELGFVPAVSGLTPMDSGLTGSDCDHGHLCLAVTVPDGMSLLWAVADVTAGRLAGVVRTPVQTEEATTRAMAGPQLCPAAGSVSRGGWVLKYETTPTDGFRVYDATYAGVEVLRSAKIVEWHVDYGTTGFTDATGCGGTGGYTILPSGETEIADVVEGGSTAGFEVRQDFRMPNWGNNCNYRYGQTYQFFNDGRFRVVVAAYGRGCSMTGIYRPVMRLDLAIAGQAGDTFATWTGLHWQNRATEGWWPQNSIDTPEGYAWRVRDASGMGYYVEPGTGQFGDAGRGDYAYIYASRHQTAEGDTDLGAIGYCCNDDQNQGPESYLNGELIAGADLVLWYVAQLQTEADADGYYCWTVSTDETYPCPAGPMFVPIPLEREYLPIFNK